MSLGPGTDERVCRNANAYRRLRRELAHCQPLAGRSICLRCTSRSVARLQGVGRNTASPKTTGTTLFGCVPHAFPVGVHHHHMHPGVRVAELKLDDLTFD